MFHEKISFKVGAVAAASEFCEWVQVGIDVYIHLKYQVKPHPSPWFSAACAAAIVRKNHFFFFCKSVLEPSKLAYANKTKESVTSHKLGS